MISDALTLIDFLKKHWTEYSVKSALFDPEGNRIEGDSFIEVEKIPKRGDQRIWFYRAKEKEGYEFVYMPVIPSLYVDYGVLNGTSNPDVRVFRFVGNPMSMFTDGGAPNVLANFVVVGYKPKDLLSARESA